MDPPSLIGWWIENYIFIGTLIHTRMTMTCCDHWDKQPVMICVLDGTTRHELLWHSCHMKMTPNFNWLMNRELYFDWLIHTSDDDMLCALVHALSNLTNVYICTFVLAHHVTWYIISLILDVKLGWFCPVRVYLFQLTLKWLTSND